MDYKKIAEAIKLCGSTPKVDQCKKCVYWSGGDIGECIPRMTEDAAAAITDLLSRAEAAEARCTLLDEARENANEACAKWEGMYHMALERAKKAVSLLPVADVAPAVHGKWEPTKYPFMNECEDCSNCGYRTVYGHGFNYCPNCGAKMDG